MIPVYLSDSVSLCEIEAHHRIMERQTNFDASRVQSYWDGGDPYHDRPLYRSSGGIAIVSIEGFLDQKDSYELAWIGGTSYDGIVKAITAANADSNIRAIILDVNSPGGRASGMSDTAEAIRNMRGGKPIHALANSMACSAAIGIATAANTFSVTQSSITGSIGTVVQRRDMTKYEEQLGIKFHVISVGKEKSYGNPSLPMSADELASYEAMVKWFYDNFTACLAVNLGVEQSHVVSKWGDAHVYLGSQAVDVGLASRVTTLTQLMAELGSQPSSAIMSKGSTNNVHQASSSVVRFHPRNRIVPRPTG